MPIVREGAPEAEARRSPAPHLDDRRAPPAQRVKLQKSRHHDPESATAARHKADIAAHINYLISLYCRSRGLTQPQVSPEALRRLQGYDFPGNLSELAGLSRAGDHPIERRACADRRGILGNGQQQDSPLPTESAQRESVAAIVSAKFVVSR